MRILTIGNPILQTLLRPLHDWTMSVLKLLPTDGTYNQTAPLQRLAGRMNLYSDDLKAATDSLPSAVSAVLLGAIFGFSLGTTWFDILTGVSFRNVNDRKVRFEDRERGWFFTKGQPLGFYSSWPVFALTHHALVWLAASKAYPGTVFQDYAILGDDLVIADSKVAREYVRLMDCLKVTISKEKSLISSTGACEFAKKFLTEGGRVDLSPVSLKVVNLFGGFRYSLPFARCEFSHIRSVERRRVPVVFRP